MNKSSPAGKSALERTILYLKIPNFSLAVARVNAPSLKGRPLVMVPAENKRVIQQVSLEAAREGVCVGMALQQGQRLCKKLHALVADPNREHNVHRVLVHTCQQLTPRVEAEPSVPRGRFYLDLSGTVRLHGAAIDQAIVLQRQIDARLQLPTQIGIAGNKLVSRIAAKRLNGEGVLKILPGCEAPFLAPLPLHNLPGIGPDLQAQLREMNLHAIGQLALFRREHLHPLFGSSTEQIYRWAQGIDPRPVCPPPAHQTITARRVFPRAITDPQRLRRALRRLTDECGYRLREKGVGCQQLHLQLIYVDGVHQKRQRTLSLPEHHDATLYQHVIEVLDQVALRRPAIRQLTVGCHQLAPSIEQPTLFEQRPFSSQVEQATDRIRRRYGFANLWWAG